MAKLSVHYNPMFLEALGCIMQLCLCLKFHLFQPAKPLASHWKRLCANRFTYTATPWFFWVGLLNSEPATLRPPYVRTDAASSADLRWLMHRQRLLGSFLSGVFACLSSICCGDAHDGFLSRPVAPTNLLRSPS